MGVLSGCRQGNDNPVSGVNNRQFFTQTNAGITWYGAKHFSLPFGIWLALAGCFRMNRNIHLFGKVFHWGMEIPNVWNPHLSDPNKICFRTALSKGVPETTFHTCGKFNDGLFID